MRARFDQVRVDIAPAGEIDVSSAADSIIASHRALQVAAAVGAGGSACNDIIAVYAKVLKPVLLLIIRQSILYDAEVLPFGKDVIKSALVECAGQQMWSESEREVLGDLYFYLSYFRVGLTKREGEPGNILLAEQRAEGFALRAEWRSMMAGRKQSKLSQFFLSWLKH